MASSGKQRPMVMTTASPIADRLRCPECHGALRRGRTSVAAEPVENSLECEIHGEFSVLGDIPMFAPSANEPFDEHWKVEADSSPPRSKFEAAIRFLEPAAAPLREGGLSCLDAGCGDGVHVDVMQRLGAGSDIVAFDISLQALRSLGNRNADTSRVQGTMLKLPFRDGSFDLSISFGSVAYTGNAAKAVSEICRVTTPGGLVGIWLMSRPRSFATRLVLNSLRAVAGRVPAFWRRRLADAIVPLLAFVPTASGVSLRNATWQQCREVVLVNIAPVVLEFPRAEDVRAWLEDCGCVVLTVQEGVGLSIWARKAGLV